MEPTTSVVATSEVFDGVQTILTQLQQSVSITQVVEIVGICLGASVGFFLLIWAVRKAVAAVQGGLKKGKLKAF